MLEVRGFTNPNLVLQWHTIHQDCSKFFPVRLICIENGFNILYVKPNDKMSAIHFSFIKNEIIQALHCKGFTSIKDIVLSKHQS